MEFGSVLDVIQGFSSQAALCGMVLRSLDGFDKGCKREGFNGCCGGLFP